MPKINLVTDNAKPSELLPVAKMVAQQFITRSDTQTLKGKKRDEMALEYVLGAASAMQVTGNDTKMNSLLLLASLISVRGYKFLNEFANSENTL